MQICPDPAGMELKPGQVVELFEPKVVLILRDSEKPDPVIVERHVVTVNSITVPG